MEKYPVIQRNNSIKKKVFKKLKKQIGGKDNKRIIQSKFLR